MPVRRERGAGDRWLAGERVPNVRFAWHEAVRVVEGAHAGRAGCVLLLVATEPEPVYLVALAGVRAPARVPQGALRSVPVA